MLHGTIKLDELQTPISYCVDTEDTDVVELFCRRERRTSQGSDESAHLKGLLKIVVSNCRKHGRAPPTDINDDENHSPQISIS